MNIEDYRASHANDEFVVLDDDTIDAAIRHGVRMRNTSLRLGHSDRHGYAVRPPTPEKAKRTQALGAVAEAAARHAFGFIALELASEIYSDPDLPGNIEVKLIGLNHYGMRVYPDTKDSRRVVGVVIPKNKERGHPYRLPGWFIAGEAKRLDWRIAPFDVAPFYAVPQECLRHNEELREILRSEGIKSHSNNLQSLRACAQCCGGVATNPPTDAPTIPVGTYLLHPECVRFFK